MIVKLIDSFDSNFEFKSWWLNNQLNSPLQRFGIFIEKILLTEIKEHIVIFIDEIDSVLSLDFPTDDFFAFVRSCYNKRVDNPDYNRLSFCLLGVASPSNLIQDKKRTPFNIGKAIHLNGFQLQEVQALEKGLYEKFSEPHAVMREILKWTGGQPFLTQKLCQLMVEESKKENPRSVEQVVDSRIIENWESQDEPEHLRTIRDRTLRDEQQAGYLLEVYQQVLQEGEVIDNKSDVKIEIMLSGLVIQQHRKLKVYNLIYKKVFNLDWIQKVLADLRPYSQALNAWLASNKDESWLLRERALRDAQEWAADKKLGSDDTHFIDMSRERERRKLEEALKSHTFRFKTEEASSVTELIKLCDKHPNEAEDFLFTGYFERWLVGQGRTDLAIVSEHIVNSYKQQRSRGLESFVRELCKSEGVHPYPKFIINDNKILNIGEVPVGYKDTINVRVDNIGRGFAWGNIKCEPCLAGIDISNAFDSSIDKILSIKLDTIDVVPGKYNGYIVIQIEGVDDNCQIHVHYKVHPIKLYINKTEVNLGNVIYNQVYFKNLLELNCEPITGIMKGVVSNNLAQIQIIPNYFEASSLSLSLQLNTTSLEEYGWYKDTIFISTNAGNYQVNVTFQTPIKWEAIAGNIALVASWSAILMFFTRWLITNLAIDAKSTTFCYLKSALIDNQNFINFILPNERFGVTSYFIGLILFIFLAFSSIPILGKVKSELFLHLIVVSILPLLIISIVTGYFLKILKLLGSILIIVFDLMSSSFLFFNVNNLLIAWLILGLIIGSLITIIYRIKGKDFFRYKIVSITFSVSVLLLAGCINLKFKTFVCN
ncbi:AAA-like domain-containing protein [Nostoc sp. NMS9]|uniref:AAA-like domain-containing protein n=1 Tax=Nostoc sp. NMS9 TaxID=2815393 RepID=UPI0025D4B403|nr:AAA-like domain-containing protein [Nostoc sp. NMS9]MBN3941861.1 AAA-like domain-containing protein [Nostoc sp. NMS9]